MLAYCLSLQNYYKYSLYYAYTIKAPFVKPQVKMNWKTKKVTKIETKLTVYNLKSNYVQNICIHTNFDLNVDFKKLIGLLRVNYLCIQQ